MKTRFKFLFLLIVLLLGSHAHAKWIYEEKKDRMGYVSAMATSELISPEESLEPPLDDFRAELRYFCNTEYGQFIDGLYLSFGLTGVILRNTQNRESYHDQNSMSVRMRINFDDDRYTELLPVIPFPRISENRESDPSAIGVLFSPTQKFLPRFMQHSLALIEVDIKGASQPAYFPFDLTGSSEAINNAQRACKG